MRARHVVVLLAACGGASPADPLLPARRGRRATAPQYAATRCSSSRRWPRMPRTTTSASSIATVRTGSTTTTITAGARRRARWSAATSSKRSAAPASSTRWCAIKPSDAAVVLGGRVTAIEEVDEIAKHWIGPDRARAHAHRSEDRRGRVDPARSTRPSRCATQTPEGLARAISIGALPDRHQSSSDDRRACERARGDRDQIAVRIFVSSCATG